METNELFQTLLVYALPVLFAITVHEAAHGYVARHFGDPTAWSLGRVTLNPLKHIDPIGTIVMPVALAILTKGSFIFGYAKPVPVRFDLLRNPKQHMIWVALAGPVSNLIQGFIWAILLLVLKNMDVQDPFFVGMSSAGVWVNLVLFALNLFPIPPLDGGRVLTGLLPYRLAVPFSRIEPWGFFIVIGLLMAGVLPDFWILPIVEVTQTAMRALLALVGLR